MTEQLRDPNKPAHEIINNPKVDDYAIRNDGVRLTAANKNPWYVLATIYGEYTETPRNLSVGSSFHCDQLDDIRGRFLQRTDNGLEPPKRNFVLCDEEEPEIGECWQAEFFNNLFFTKPIYFDGFLFDDMVSFSNSSFLDEACFSKTLFFAVNSP